MKAHQYSKNCLNCNKELAEQDNYCRNCGQKRQRQKLSLMNFVKDSLSSFIALDGPIFLTLRSLFLRPGFMARDFVSGMRVRYLNPVRVYFLSSLFMLFLTVSQNEDAAIINTNFAIEQDTSLVSQEKIDARIAELPEIYHLPEAPWHEKIEAIQTLLSLQPQMSEEEALRRLQLPHTNYNRFWYNQAWKLQQINAGNFEEKVNRSFRSKLLWILFLMVPFLALALKLLYLRRGVFYLNHLSFAFYQQSLVFLLIGLFGLFHNQQWAYPITALLAGIHQFIAMRNFYGQSYRKTFLKFLLYLTLTFLIVIFGFLISTVIVFILL